MDVALASMHTALSSVSAFARLASPLGILSAGKGDATAGERVSPCFDPATPAMVRAPVDGAAQRAPSAARCRSSAHASPTGASDNMTTAVAREAAVPASSHGEQPVTQQSHSPVVENGVSAATAPQQGMQLRAAVAAAGSNDDGEHAEEEVQLCAMRPVVNLPCIGKTPLPADTRAPAKPQQGRQTTAGARAQAPGRRSALRRSQGHPAVSLSDLSGMAMEQAVALPGGALPKPSVLDYLCAEVEFIGTPGNGVSDMDVGPPCRTSPTMTGVPTMHIAGAYGHNTLQYVHEHSSVHQRCFVVPSTHM